MTSTGVLVAMTVTETGVITTAGFSAVAWLHKSNQARQDSQDKKLADIATSLAVLESKADDRDARLTTVEKRVEEASGNLNALSLVVERMSAVFESNRSRWDGSDRRRRQET